jgi:hypothetical protein
MKSRRNIRQAQYRPRIALFISTGRNGRKPVETLDLLKNRGYRGGFSTAPAKKVSRHP